MQKRIVIIAALRTVGWAKLWREQKSHHIASAMEAPTTARSCKISAVLIMNPGRLKVGKASNNFHHVDSANLFHQSSQEPVYFRI